MTQAGSRLIAAAKQARAAVFKAERQKVVLTEWDMGQARTCLVCGDVFLTRKNLRIHRAKHRNKLEMPCEKIVIT